tara:strand:- start:23594 stop:23899 length:306 start_codon:yes stop_codon:yes gene_type:complete
MKKTFPFEEPPHQPARVVERIKSNVRKYIKRERRKPLVEGADFWAFDCRVGKKSEEAKPIHEAELIQAIDIAAKDEWTEIYIEILAKPAYRTKKENPESNS